MNQEDSKGSAELQIDDQNQSNNSDEAKEIDDVSKDLEPINQNAVDNSKLNSDSINLEDQYKADDQKMIENKGNTDVNTILPIDSSISTNGNAPENGENNQKLANFDNENQKYLNQTENNSKQLENSNNDIIDEENHEESQKENENKQEIDEKSKENATNSNDDQTEKEKSETKGENKETETKGETKEPVDDFAYLKYDRETFTNPVLRKKWEEENQARFKRQEEEEKRMMEEMAKRAQQQREAFLKQVHNQQEQRKSKNAKIKPPPPKNENDEDEIDNDDPVVGWSQVMKMAKPMKPKANQDQLKSVRKLYFSMKS